jgi:hypothetical protein
VFAFLAGVVVAFVVAGLLAFGGATAEFGGGSNRLEL